ncbi:MAG: T9SS type B sorting domain-containing protein [Bacteroidota bacterium]
MIIFFVYYKGIAQTTNISGIINNYVSVTSVGTQTVLVSNTVGFTVGDRVLLIQMKGANIQQSNSPAYGSIININDCGNYELKTIASISTNTITFTTPLFKSYTTTGLVQLVKVPVYNNATVTALLTCSPWNGATGGILAFECTGTLNLFANIDASGKGFRGGGMSAGSVTGCAGDTAHYIDPGSYMGSGIKGEGIFISNPLNEKGRGSNANGGGAGTNINGGGAGGANYADGGYGGNIKSSASCPPAIPLNCGGIYGRALPYSNALNKIFLGGGAGSGHMNDNAGTVGTNGGGIILIRANTITVNNNFIISNGLDNNIISGIDGQGGGGAGGTILVDACSSPSLNISAKGGKGGTDNYGGPDCHGKGGGGSGGIIWSSGSLAGATINVSGGQPGIFTLTSSWYYNTPGGASGGQAGGTLTGLSIPGAVPLSVGSFSFTTSSNCMSNNNSTAIGTVITNALSPVFSFIWTNSSGVIINQTTNTSSLVDSVPNLANGIYTLTVQMNAPCGPISTQTLNINCVIAPSQYCGGSLEFNNISDAVSLPLNNQIHSSNGFTWECWFKLNATFASNPRALINSIDAVSYEDIYLGFGWNYGAGNVPINHLGFKVDGPNATTGPASVSCDYMPAGGFLLGTWYHAAGVMDYIAHTSKLYVNGLLVDTKIENADPFSRTIQSQLSYDPSLALGGNMDEVRIWNKVRSDSEIFADYSHCLVGNETNLLSYYRCNQSTGNILIDATPNGNGGNLINSTQWSPQQPNISGLACGSGVSFSVTSSPTICAGVTTTLSAIGATTYTWSNNIIANSISVNPSITTTYTVNGSNGSCSSQTVVTVVVIPNPTLTLSPNATLCVGASVSVTLTANGAGSYVWNNASSLSASTGGMVMATPNATTIYTVTGTTGLCTNTAVVTVSVTPTPTITATAFNHTSCGLVNGSATVTASPANNTFSWSGGVSSTTNTADSLAPGNYSVTVSNGSCQTNTVISIQGSVPLVITASTIIASNCDANNGSITVTDNLTASNYSWNPNVSLTNNATGLASGNYSLTVSNGVCTTSTVFVVSSIGGPVSSVTTIDAVCGSANGVATVTNVVNGLSPYQYNFNNAGFSPAITYSNLVSGNYLLIVKDANGCLYTQTVTVGEASIQLLLGVTANAPNCFENDGSFVINNITGGVPPYTSNFNNNGYSTDTIFTQLGVGSYTLNVMDSNNCETGFILVIPENDGEHTLYIPNTFTPNNNVVNDIWYVKGTCLNQFNCIIYNRWGEKIRELKDIKEGWDGTYKGAPVPDGVYVYLIEIETKSGTVKKAGHITLFR